MKNYTILFTIFFATVATCFGQGALRESDIDTKDELNTILTDANVVTSKASAANVSYIQGASGVSMEVTHAAAYDVADGDFSVFAWVKLPNPMSTTQHLIGKQDGLSGAGWWLEVTSEGTIQIDLNSSGGGPFGLSSRRLDDDLWHSVVVVLDKTNDLLKWYIDGALVDQTGNIAFFNGRSFANTDPVEMFGNGFNYMDEGYAAHYIGFTKDIITEEEVVLMSEDPRYVLELDNLALAVELSNFAEGVPQDRGPNGATVSVIGGSLVFDTNRFNDGTVSNLTEESGIATGDFIMFYDTTAGELRKVNWDDFWAGTLATVNSGLTSGDVPLLAETVVDNDWLRMTATGVEGLTNTETLSALGIGSSPVSYDDVTANFTGTLQQDGSDVVLDTDIGVTVQGHDSTTAKYDDATANFTGNLQNAGSDVLLDSDLGNTAQAYDSDTAKYDDATANFTGTLQTGGLDVATVGDLSGESAVNSFPALRSPFEDNYIWFKDQVGYDTDTGDFSVFFWIRSDTSESDGLIIKRMNEVAGFAVVYNGDDIDVMFGNTGAQTRYSDVITNIDDGEWHSIVITFNRNGDITGYLDGVAQPVPLLDFSSQSSVDITTDAIVEILDSEEANYNSLGVAWIGGFVGFSDDLISPTEALRIAKSPQAIMDMNRVVCAVNLMGGRYSAWDEIHPQSSPNYAGGRIDHFGSPPSRAPSPMSLTNPTSSSSIVLDAVADGQVFFLSVTSGNFDIILPDADNDYTDLKTGDTITFIVEDDVDVSTEIDIRPSVGDATIMYRSIQLTELNLTQGETVTLAYYDNPSSTSDAWYVLGELDTSPLELVAPPPLSNSSGVAGQIAYDADYFYICISDGTWARAPISIW